MQEFDEAKRSCRRRLAGHNERRRKAPTTTKPPGEGSSGKVAAATQVKENQCRPADEMGRVPMTLSGNVHCSL
ncbi:hypothetical protein Dimus_012674 [Dionaea muscipula]